MAIRLRQPRFMQVHFEDIARVESAYGDDRRRGTWIYLRDVSEPRFCEETANRVRELIAEEKSKEEVKLNALAVSLLLTAAEKSSDGRLQFTESAAGLTVMAGGSQLEPLRGRDRSKYEHAEQQFSAYELVVEESKGAYRLNERGYQLAEFLHTSQQSYDLPFSGFVKLPERSSMSPSQIGVQFNQWNTNTGDVNSAVSEQGDIDQSIT